MFCNGIGSVRDNITIFINKTYIFSSITFYGIRIVLNVINVLVDVSALTALLMTFQNGFITSKSGWILIRCCCLKRFLHHRGRFDNPEYSANTVSRYVGFAIINFLMTGFKCVNCFSVLENSQSLAQGNRLRVSLSSESANTFSGLAALAAVLYVTIFSSTLSCISDVVFICFQCTGNQNCFKAFLYWNAIDILINFVCDIALYYMVQSVTSEGYKALHSVTETAEEEIATSSWDYMQATLMDKFPPGREEVDSDETPTEVITTRSESYPKKVIAFTETLRLKPSLSYIVLVALFKVTVLAIFQQNAADHDDLGSSSYPQDASSSSMSRIAVWKALYAQHRSRLQTIRERALEMQSTSPAEESEPEQPRPATEAHPDLATPATESDKDGSAEFPKQQEDVGLSANPEHVLNEDVNTKALISGTGHLGGVDLSSDLGNHQPNKDADANLSQRPRQFLNEKPSMSR
ncbi:uncharacterized protein LOC119448151 [Dermacentor silvarum]|uniref:uncharacterized protein LOC119448151 n=1 Tax=Dermacentor silvarum TaxID=543639 RepID=UPI00210188B3|nr:uncharacterized protein LOC119448151 [Dermacentor silvarum]